MQSLLRPITSHWYIRYSPVIWLVLELGARHRRHVQRYVVEERNRFDKRELVEPGQVPVGVLYGEEAVLSLQQSPDLTKRK
jgi:hypothetical protein